MQKQRRRSRRRMEIDKKEAYEEEREGGRRIRESKNK